MRWFFLFLLVLNLFYYVWHQQQAPLKPKEVPPLALYQNQKGDIRLLSEGGAPPRRERTSEQASASGSEVCLFLGGFDSEAGAQKVEQRLVSLDIASQVRALDAAAGMDYWVYLAPLASRQASLRQLKELQARKIDSYIITQGDLANGISLGMFPRMESADKVMLRLRDAGYEPMLRELPRAHRNYWVRIEVHARRLLDDALLQQLGDDFPGLEHRLMPCEGVAAPR